MREVIGYDDNGNYVLGDDNGKKVKYRLIKVGKKYVVQKGFTFTKTTGEIPERVTKYSDITDILDYETAKAKMYILQGKCEVIEEFSV